MSPSRDRRRNRPHRRGAFDDAALAASLQALERSGTDHADLALVFITGDDALPQAHQALHACAAGAPAVLGCSGVGVSPSAARSKAIRRSPCW